MLILSNEEIESFLSIDKCIAALEQAYAHWDEGKAINRPRSDLIMPSSNEAGVYAFKSMEAGLYNPPIVALRINSDIIRWHQQGSRTIKTKVPAAPGDKYVGLGMLFSTLNGEPLFWLSAPELRDLIAGRVQGRGSAQESTCFLNNIGMGLQFAAVGAAVLAEAKSSGAGREIPTDWFLETVHP